MNQSHKQLLGEMIDTIAESNPGLARAWHKLLETSCSDDCSTGSTSGT